MLSSYSGFVKRRRRGAVVIMAPLSSTALESSGEIYMDVLVDGLGADMVMVR
jgi:hypothetical protein